MLAAHFKINKMKQITIILFFFPTLAFSQFGVSLSYSAGNFWDGNFYGAKKESPNRFYFGYGNRNGGQKKLVSERKSNYGTKEIERGNYSWLIDLGYGRVIRKKITISPELSIGEKVFFTTYEDKRFNGGGYSLITKKETITGVGISLGAVIKSRIEPFIGYNTVKKLFFGFRFGLVNN